MLRSVVETTKLLGNLHLSSQARNYAIAKRKLIRKEYFVYKPKMKSRYKGNPNPRLKLILTEDVDKIGFKGDLVEVKRGTGRLNLIPNKLAVYATDENMLKYGIDPNNVDETLSSKVPQNVLKYLRNHTIKLHTPFLPSVHEETRDNWMITRHDIGEYFYRHSKLYVPVHCMSIVDCEDDIVRNFGKFTVEITLNKIITVPVPMIVEQRPDEDEDV